MIGNHPRLVYFARRTKDGAIKIGCSAWPKYRIKELSGSANGKIELLATAPGGFPVERELHQKFAEDRIAGEWFSETPDLADLIEEVKAGGVVPFAKENRDDIIARRWLAGETLQAIGDDVGLSRERVRVIVATLKLRPQWRNVA